MTCNTPKGEEPENDTDFSDRHLVLYCDNANKITQEFNSELSSMKTGSKEWNEFIETNIESNSNIVQILSYEAIGSNDGSTWLGLLFEQLNKEADATILSAIICAIGKLGGFKAPEDYARFFEDTDVSRRSAAMQIVHFVSHADAIIFLLKILKHDPDILLRRAAAERLAYLKLDAGLKELLDCLNNEMFQVRISAACALCALNNPIGINFVRDLLELHSVLSMQDRTNLVFSLTKLLFEVGIELKQCNAEDGLPAESILSQASDWIGSKVN